MSASSHSEIFFIRVPGIGNWEGLFLYSLKYPGIYGEVIYMELKVPPVGLSSCGFGDLGSGEW